MVYMIDKKKNRVARRRRVRSKVKGTEIKPRCAVFRSNTALSAQIIDDVKGVTLCGISTRVAKETHKKKAIDHIADVLAQEMQKKGIREIVFDRGGFEYTGNIAYFADALRSKGILF